MRIIAGDARGRKLVAPAGEMTRPTSDKLRGSLFNILGTRALGARVIDLFGGTGALALEAMSRGAASAVLVDVDHRAIEAMRANAQSVLGAGYESRVLIVKADYKKAIEALPGAPFTIAFLDPPYAMYAAYADAIARLSVRGLIAEDGIVVCERARGTEPVQAAGFQICDARVYGDTFVDILRRER